MNNEFEALVAIYQKMDVLIGLARAAAPKPIASDAELDGQYGDPEIRFNPKAWTGSPIKGLRMSACPPAALDILADSFEWMADKNEAEKKVSTGGKPIAPMNRNDAARARGWARRLRNGFKPTTASDGAAFSDDPTF